MATIVLYQLVCFPNFVFKSLCFPINENLVKRNLIREITELTKILETGRSEIGSAA